MKQIIFTTFTTITTFEKKKKKVQTAEANLFKKMISN